MKPAEALSAFRTPRDKIEPMFFSHCEGKGWTGCLPPNEIGGRSHAAFTQPGDWNLEKAEKALTEMREMAAETHRRLQSSSDTGNDSSHPGNHSSDMENDSSDKGNDIKYVDSLSTSRELPTGLESSGPRTIAESVLGTIPWGELPEEIQTLLRRHATNWSQRWRSGRMRGFGNGYVIRL